MARQIWDGKGELPEGAAYWTKNNGELVGRNYVRARARQQMRWWQGACPSVITESRVQHALLVTIESDEWMSGHSQETVGSVARAAVDRMWEC